MTVARYFIIGDIIILCCADDRNRLISLCVRFTGENVVFTDGPCSADDDGGRQ